MKWVSPLTHNDPDNLWIDETAAYDGELDTFAMSSVWAGEWGSFLELMRPLVSNTLRVSVYWTGGSIDMIEIGVWEQGWRQVYCGAFPLLEWREFVFNQGRILGARVRFHSNHPSSASFVHIHEVEFNEVEGRGLDVFLGEFCKPRFLPSLDSIAR